MTTTNTAAASASEESMIDAFERHYAIEWSDSELRNERMAWIAAWRAALAAPAQPAAPARAGEYPELPMQFACSGVFTVYSADQMRAYVDADQTARASEGDAP